MSDIIDPARLQKLTDLRAANVEPYPTGTAPTLTAIQAIDMAAELPTDEDLATLGSDLVFTGRVMAKNDMGKIGFARVQDATGRLQTFVRQNLVGEDAFALWKKLDLGDWVEFEGSLMRTRAGELSLLATRLRLVGKCVRSLPDKVHGVEDPEVRRRQRYLDLIVNEDSRATFATRSRIVRLVRSFFDDLGFMEVETPMLHAIPGGATARPFRTHHNALDSDMYLRIAPELHLKRLIVGGFERVFEINRCFRNEGIDSTHNPEFTTLEFYQAHATYQDLMALTERLLRHVAISVLEGGTAQVSYQGQVLDFWPAFQRVEYGDLVAEALGLPVEDVYDVDKLRAAIGPSAPATMGACWEHVFDERVEATLIRPTFVVGFPVGISPLARRSDTNPLLADRFELYVAGREIANGFNELADPVDQAARFAEQAAVKGGMEGFYDADFVEALCYGMPPTAGEGIGIDRLVMLLTDRASIRDVILFPTLRSQMV